MTYPNMTRKVYNDMIWVKNKLSKLNVEVKHFDQGITRSTVDPAANAFTHLSQLAIGDTDVTRDGNSVKAVSLSYNFGVRPNVGTPESTRMRIFILQSTFGEGVVPDLVDVLDDATDFDSFRNLDMTKGYKLLLDKVVNINITGNAISTVSGTIPLSHHLKYDGPASSEHTYGQLWFFAIDDFATEHPAITGLTRLRFVDN